jgi:hypothetical protein
MSKRSSGESSKRARHERTTDTPSRKTLRAILFALLLLAAWSTTFIFYTYPEQIKVVVGEPSPRDIKAPRQVTYISEVRTREARQAAESAVKDVYTGPDMAIGSQQIRRLQDITDYITAIRYDQYADKDAKVGLLREIPTLNLTVDGATRILGLEEDEWRSAAAESSRILDLILREEIRDSQNIEARHQVRRLVAPGLSDEQQTAVASLIQNMIVPNSYYDAKLTLASREAARDAVQPVHWTIREGESILREGEIVTDLALEKLQVLGLLSSGTQWQDRVSIILFSTALVVALSAYVVRTQPLLLSRPRRQLLLVLTLIGVGLAVRMTIPGHTILPYLFPAAAITMLVTILLDVQLAMVVSGIVALLVGFSAGGSIELVVYSFVGGMVAALAIWRTDQLGTFIRTTVYVALANMAIILAFHLRTRAHDAVGLVQLMVAGIGNAILSSGLTFAAFSFVGRLFGITTSLQLLDLARPTHPLFRQLLIKAPGTYHHSIIISNMAEQAAEAIGADALLSRVGSYYHDIGKVPRPYFFAENQGEGENPHDKLDPRTSAEIIMAHTADGLVLARKYNLPDKVRDFIPEHHGTYLVTYFYHRANQENGKETVLEEDYRYPGPKPQSRETAIVMLADSIEATVRAKRPASQADMERMIYQIVNDRLLDGQLDECDLTIKDLDKIRAAFITVLQGIFHPRIQYPEGTPQQNGTAGNGTPARADR